MQISLIKGCFNSDEAMDLLTQLLHVKIRFHENKIKQSHNIEDIEHREQRIIELQKSLYDIHRFVKNGDEFVDLSTDVYINERRTKYLKTKNNVVAL